MLLQSNGSIQAPVVTLFVSCQETQTVSERRFERAWTIATVKERVEPITGVPSATMKIVVYSSKDEPVCVLDDDSKMLGYYPLSNFMRLHVTDTNQNRVKGAFTDLSLVEKFEISMEEYEKREDSVRAFKERTKIGRFAEKTLEQIEAQENEFKEEASKINVGDRCQADAADGELKKRGVVKFVGQTKFKPGYWIGIQYDEPLGKHNGTVNGVKYFECPSKHGVFVRPTTVQVGDFPEDDQDLLDLMDEI